MPFDGTPQKTRFDPTLPNLAILLRDRSLWPKRFRWDYRRVDSCAIGLADRKWRLNDGWRYPDTVEAVKSVFDIPSEGILFMFFGGSENAKPKDIADRIDRWIAGERPEPVIEGWHRLTGDELLAWMYDSSRWPSQN